MTDNQNVILAIMSMNINGQASWYPDEPAKQWKTRAPLVRKVVEQWEPDIVCWQEFGVTSHTDAFQTSRHLMEFYLGEEAGDIYINPISWNPHKLRCVESRTMWLSDDGTYGRAWEGAERGCSVVLLEDIATKKRCWIYNLHLDNKSKKARKESMSVILADMSAQPRRYPILVAGDFNASSRLLPGKEAHFDPTPLRRLEDAGFSDVMHIKYGDDQMPPPTFHGYHGRAFHPDLDPYGVWDPDHIFVYRFEVLDTTIIETNENKKYPSDHYPIMTTVVM